MLFIVIHQTYELWFKQILFELDLIQGVFGGRIVDDAKIAGAVHAAERIVKIEQLLVSQFDILETMTPMDFLEFRDFLVPASGFQSEQFRVLETRLGLEREDRLLVGGVAFDEPLTHAARGRIHAVEHKDSLRDQIDKWLARTPFLSVGGFEFREVYIAALNKSLEAETRRVGGQMSEGEKAKLAGSLEKHGALLRSITDDALFESMKADGAWAMSRKALEAALFVFLYRDEPALHLPFKMLSLLMDIDETLALWRLRHALMVQRMIGQKTGTGGTVGYGYLRATAEKHRIYKDLFALTTFLIPRSALPQLPESVRKSMRYQYEGG